MDPPKYHDRIEKQDADERIHPDVAGRRLLTDLLRRKEEWHTSLFVVPLCFLESLKDI